MMIKQFAMGALAAVALAVSAAPSQAATVVDSGQPPFQSGGYALTSGQWLGARFAVTEATTITSIKGYLGNFTVWEPDDTPIDLGSKFTIVLSTDGSNRPNLPIYSVGVDLGAGQTYVQDWYGAENLDWDLDIGTYWVSFEVHFGDDFHGYMAGGAPNPLLGAAFYQPFPYGWSQAGSIIPFGVRIEGASQSAVPEPATWAMMITGFGLAGVAVRRRREAARAMA